MADDDRPHPTSGLTLRHAPAEGTLLEGTTKGDGAAAALQSVRHLAYWKWSRPLGCWYIARSRDRRAYGYQLTETADALRAAGFEVTVELSDDKRSVDEIEADRAGRTKHRVEQLSQRSATLRARGEAGWAAAREFAQRWPVGQPILVGHHSEGRHRRDIATLDRMDDQAIAQLKGAEEAQQQAAAAHANQAHRLNGAMTVRRIAKLTADLNRAQRALTRTTSLNGDASTEEERAADDAHLSPIIADLEDQLTYWTEYLRGLVDAGVYRVWTQADFQKGDYVGYTGGWAQVMRPNLKSVTIRNPFDATRTGNLPYDKVFDRRSADDHAAARRDETEALRRAAKPVDVTTVSATSAQLRQR